MFESYAAIAGHLKLGIVGGLGLGGRDVPDRLEEAAFVEPVDPFEGGELDRFEAAPGAAPMDHLGFVEAVDGFGEGIVVAVTDAADRRLDARLGEPLGIFDRDVLGGIKWSSQHLDEGVAMGTRKRRSDRAGRGVLRSPGRPGVARREDRRRFWARLRRAWRVRTPRAARVYRRR